LNYHDANKAYKGREGKVPRNLRPWHYVVASSPLHVSTAADVARSVSWLWYELDERGLISTGQWSDFLPWSPSPDRLWGPPSHLSKRYQRLFPASRKVGASSSI